MSARSHAFSALTREVERHRAATNNGAHLLAESLLDDRLPGHEAEPHAVIKHREPSAGEHDRPSVHAARRVPVSYGAMLEAGLARQPPSDLIDILRPQRRQEVACEDEALSPSGRETLRLQQG